MLAKLHKKYKIIVYIDRLFSEESTFAQWPIKKPRFFNRGLKKLMRELLNLYFSTCFSQFILQFFCFCLSNAFFNCFRGAIYQFFGFFQT